VAAHPASTEHVESLGGGLIRRWTSAADTEKFAVLIGTVFRDPDDELPASRPMVEARLMMRPSFPYMTPYDVAVVEDTSKPERPLVACTCLWRHTWSYGGIPFGVGRPEMVATHPDYRNRGLVRALFEMVHARSEAEGHLLQAITGIPYFYRQFGYEYALDLEDGRTVYFQLIPDLKAGEDEACSLRLATHDDLPTITALYEGRRPQSLVWHEASESRWRFVIDVWHDALAAGEDIARGAIKGRYCMIVDAAGEVCGYLWVRARRWSRGLGVGELTFRPGTDVVPLLPSLLRRLREIGEQTPAVKADAPPCTELNFQLDGLHPVYDLLDTFAPRINPPYAWYVRVPQPETFLHHIGSVLEGRLAESALAGHTGTVRLNLYRRMVELRFEQGRLATVDAGDAPLYEDDDRSALGCPPLTFLQLLLGYRDLDELSAVHPDVLAADEIRPMIRTLFPKRASLVEPLG